MRYLNNVLLYTVDNDPEARLIYLIALCLGIHTIRSTQPHGAVLNNECGAIDLILATGKREVWTVELPGEYTENELRKCGITVHIIDHHIYGSLDRAHDPITGTRKKSSLEQFLELLELTDTEKANLAHKLDNLIGIGTSNRWAIIVGIGILDDRYVKGLCEVGYENHTIRAVYGLREKLGRQLDPEYDAKNEAAEQVWATRKRIGGYDVFQSDLPYSIAGSISSRSIRSNAITMAKDLEYNPMIISECSGKKLRVLNIGPEVARKLNDAFHNRHRFTYGAGRCWGSGNDILSTDITLDELLAVLT